MENLFFDYRTNGVISNTLVFPCDEAPYECSYSPKYFAEHSEHVVLATSEGNTFAQQDHQQRNPQRTTKADASEAMLKALF